MSAEKAVIHCQGDKAAFPRISEVKAAGYVFFLSCTISSHCKNNWHFPFCSPAGPTAGTTLRPHTTATTLAHRYSSRAGFWEGMDHGHKHVWDKNLPRALPAIPDRALSQEEADAPAPPSPLDPSPAPQYGLNLPGEELSDGEHRPKEQESPL